MRRWSGRAESSFTWSTSGLLLSDDYDGDDGEGDGDDGGDGGDGGDGDVGNDGGDGDGVSVFLEYEYKIVNLTKARFCNPLFSGSHA